MSVEWRIWLGRPEERTRLTLGGAALLNDHQSVKSEAKKNVEKCLRFFVFLNGRQ